MKQTYEELINKQNLTKMEYRTLNRYYLHPQNQRLCIECKTVYEGIRENFHIKSKDTFSSNCRSCLSVKNLKRRLENRKSPEQYIKRFVTSVKHRAAKAGVSFDLDSDYLTNLFYEQNEKCIYTGQHLSFDYHVNSRNHPHINMASLDRINPTEGYVKGNVAWTTFGINRMKNDLTKDQFINFCRLVVSNH